MEICPIESTSLSMKYCLLIICCKLEVCMLKVAVYTSSQMPLTMQIGLSCYRTDHHWSQIHIEVWPGNLHRSTCRNLILLLFYLFVCLFMYLFIFYFCFSFFFSQLLLR